MNHLSPTKALYNAPCLTLISDHSVFQTQGCLTPKLGLSISTPRCQLALHQPTRRPFGGAEELAMASFPARTHATLLSICHNSTVD